jgi:hypothetical protein
VILNQTGVNGLAAALSKKLTADGWTVTGLGNWKGSVPATTVYYGAGQEAAAAALAADIPGPDRTRPRVGGMVDGKLTVVIAEELNV